MVICRMVLYLFVNLQMLSCFTVKVRNLLCFGALARLSDVFVFDLQLLKTVFSVVYCGTQCQSTVIFSRKL